jgi:hypothetical protein
MQKMLFLLPIIIMVGAILVIIPNVSAKPHPPPPPPPQIAKPCQASVSIAGSGESIKSSGACSTAGSEHPSITTASGEFGSIGGSKSSCSAASVNVAGPNADLQSSNGAVSCGAHSP